MRKDVKKAWMSALRSGKYSQTQQTLCDSSGHCCLGVLAEVLAENFPDTYGACGTRFDKKRNEIKIWTGTLDYQTARLPDALGYAVGLTQADQDELSGRNDNDANFREIADYIEKNL